MIKREILISLDVVVMFDCFAIFLTNTFFEVVLVLG
jgi:hypothetical protein